MARPFAALASWSARRPAIAITFTLVAVVALGAGMGQANEGRINELFIPDDLPALRVQQDIEAIWGASEGAFLLYIADAPTDADLIRAVAHDMDKAAHLDIVKDVQGLPSLIAARVGDLQSASDADIEAAAAQLAASAAGRSFIVDDALLVRLVTHPIEDIPAAIADFDAIRDASQAPAAGADVRTAGVVYVEQYQNENAGGDVAFLMPLSLVTVVVLLALLFRRFQDVGVPMLTVILAIVMAYGTVAWSGFALAPPSFIVMPLLLGLGIDYMLHIVYAYREEDPNARVHERFERAASHVGPPVFYTAMTTLIGFGSFMVSNIPQIRTWGLLIGSGALYAFVLGFVFLPAMYRLRRRKPRTVSLPLGRVMDHATRVVLRNRVPVLVVLGLVTVGLGASAAFVDIEDSIDFEPDSDAPAVANLNAIQDRFGGQSLVQFLIPAGDRAHLDALEDAFAASQHAGFIDGPTTRLERAGQPDGALVGPATEGVATATHWLVTVGYRFTDLDDALPAFEAIAAASPLDARITGFDVMDRESQEVFLPTVAKSTGIALALVIGLLAIVFRRPLPAALAFLPLVIAIVWQLGIMNLVGIPINPITGVMTAMILGVGIDYSLHIVAHFQAGRDAGVPRHLAAAAAMRSVGRPVLAATITTVFAFSVLAFSSLAPLRDFGMVAAIAVSCAFLVSLTLVPTLAAGKRAALATGQRQVAAKPRPVAASTPMAPRLPNAPPVRPAAPAPAAVAAAHAAPRRSRVDPAALAAATAAWEAVQSPRPMSGTPAPTTSAAPAAPRTKRTAGTQAGVPADLARIYAAIDDIAGA